MSACAGSLTKAFRVFRALIFQVRSCAAVEWVPATREVFSSISPARSGWIAPGRIGFMSKQRRENRPTPATESLRGWRRFISRPAAATGRGSIRNGSRPAGRLERNGCNEIPMARVDFVNASGTAAPPASLASFHNGTVISLEAPAATSLQSDSNTLLVGLVPTRTCRGRSPYRAGRHDIRPLHPNRSPLPVLRVSIHPCRGYRQH